MEPKRSFADNKDLIGQLWPKATITNEQWATFAEFCGKLDQRILQSAIRHVAHFHSGREPNWKRISEIYGTMRESAEFKPEPRYTGTMTWHVSYQRNSRHGVPNVWYGQRCQTREEAERIAKETGGRVTCMSKADDPDDYSDEALRADEIRARECVASLTREAIAAHVSRLRSIGFLSETLPGRVTEWPRMAVLTVYAEHRLQQERRK
jgi:hypothetical protein